LPRFNNRKSIGQAQGQFHGTAGSPRTTMKNDHDWTVTIMSSNFQIADYFHF
jgi:hypothetical protein